MPEVFLNPQVSTPWQFTDAPAAELLSVPLSGGYVSRFVYFSPASDRILAPVLYLHGIQSHPGWFLQSARHLARNGHPVYMMTRRGSGANAQSRGHADIWQDLIADTAAACEFIRRETHQSAVNLVGVSWGGKLLAAFAAMPEYYSRIASLTLVAPGLAAQVKVSGLTQLCIGLSLLFSPRKRFDIPLNQPELFTDNEQMREFLRKDPLRLHKATAKFLFASRCLDRHLAQVPDGSIKAPTSLLLATKDRIIDNDRTRQIVCRLAGENTRVKTLAGAHTLEFEPDPSEFHAELCKAVSRGGG